MVDFEDDHVLPMAQEWVEKKVTAVSYDDAESFWKKWRVQIER